MAKNNHQKNNKNKQGSAKPMGKSHNKQPSEKPMGNHFNNQPTNIPNPTSKPPKCQICDKPHKGELCPFCLVYSNVGRLTDREAGECRYKNAQARPTSNCSYCGKKGHDESVCYKKNSNNKHKTPSSTSFAKKSLIIRREGRWEAPLDCQRERDHSTVSFPLTLAGTMAMPPLRYGLTSDAWLEDSDNDAIMCLHDCRSGGNFCYRRFAVRCANQLKQSIKQLDQGITEPEHMPLVISQRDEEAIWQAMVGYGVPNNGFSESSLMDIDEVF
ncbi:hypothetical protein F5883DRAFT_103074 [Diaporthe sp. PMI_573]|nr:hypothetical protein F5883DRAFT_103074 [Diaporthaceae sp. PMI_573]